MNRTEPTRETAPTTGRKVTIIDDQAMSRDAAKQAAQASLFQRLLDWRRWRQRIDERFQIRKERAHHRNMRMRDGILHKIRHATSDRQIDGLLRAGNGFTRASDGTVRKWHRAAAERKAALLGMREVVS